MDRSHPKGPGPSSQPAGEAARLAELLDHFDTLYFALDHAGRVTGVHARLALEQGLSREALIGMDFGHAFPRYTGTALERACRAALAGEPDQTLDWREPGKASQGGRWYAIRIQHLSDGIGVFLNDVTREKDQALALAGSQALLGAMAQVNPAAFYRINLKHGLPIEINGAFLSRLGYGPDTLWRSTREVLMSLLHPDDRAGVVQHFSALIAQPDGTQMTIEYRLRDASGSYCWFLSRNMIRRRDPSGAADEILGSALEITEMKETIQALEISERTFQKTFENASVGISHVGMDGRWRAANQRLCDIIGYSRDELLTMRFQDITHPDDLRDDLRQFEQLKAGDIGGYQMEKRYLHKDGHIVWVHLSITMQRDDQGAPLYAISVIQDISHRKRLEYADRFLLDLSDLLAMAQTELEAIGLVLEHVGAYLGVERCLLASPDARRHGLHIYPDFHAGLPSLEGDYPLRGVLSDIVTELGAGEQVSIADTAADPRTAAGDPGVVSPFKLRAYVFTSLPPDPSWQGVLVVASQQPRDWQPEELVLLHSVTHLMWPELQKLRLLATLRQSEADLRQSEETLRQSELHFRQALERSGLINYQQDLNLRYIWLHNPLSIFPEAEVLGKTDDDLFTPEDAASLTALKQQVLRSGQGMHGELVLNVAGRRHYFDSVMEPSYDAHGAITGLVGSGLDITARREAEEALKEYMGKLERSNQDLQDFAFIASHDLQEPLRKVVAFGTRLQEEHRGELNEEGRDYLERMIAAALRMRKMIDDLLTYSRVATKAQPFAPVDLDAAAREVLVDLETRIESEQGQVTVGPLPVIEADEAQMRQLLLNLVSNALKFHRAGVPPEVSLTAQPAGPDVVELRVRDNGVGFDTKDLARILQPFTRLHGRSEYEGSGIGLAICRRIVERHGGTITAESRPGEGSAFIVRLPLHH